MAKSKPKKSKPKQTSAQKNLNDWTKKVNSYSGGWTKSKDYKALMNSKEKQNMDASVKGYNALLDGGYGGYAKANGLTDYTARLQNMLGGILKSKFSYDADNDAAYQAYKAQYQAQGRKDMLDTMGQMASATGGYASSAATTAGNAANQAQLNNLSNTQSQLLSLAYQKYDQQQQGKQNAYDLLNGVNQQQYGQYQDAVGNAYNKMDYNTNRFNTSYSNGYTKWNDDRSFAAGQQQHYGNLNESQLNRKQDRTIADRNYALQKKILNKK